MILGDEPLLSQGGSVAHDPWPWMLVKILVAFVPVHELSQGKWILTRRCLPPGKVMTLLGVLPR
jgi:hypothetical protein